MAKLGLTQSVIYIPLGVAVLAFGLGLWQLVSLHQRAVATPEAAAQSAPEVVVTSDDVNVAKKHLFGAAPAATSPLAPATLAVTLEGIMSAADGSSAGYSALIRQESGVSKVVIVGDTVVPGAVVEKIMSDSVIINNQGRLERLQLKKPPALFK